MQSKSEIIFKYKLPRGLSSPNHILIYDRRFKNNSWVKKFKKKYAVKSGERLKNIDEFPKHIKSILNLATGISKKEITIITLGGGSVEDFGGFLSSILKRGVRLIHIPSTWLAAIDAAHGGKTGLNVDKIKNQIGTFYPAEKVYLVRELLISQPQERVLEAFGEVFKICLLEGKSLWSQFKECERIETAIYWKHLSQIIQAKNKIVARDPFEKNGYRHLLNFGHTVGHLWESQYKIPHGVAILFGLAFAIEWSFASGIMSSKHYYEVRLSGMGSYLPDRFDIKKMIKNMKNTKNILLQDKKLSDKQRIRFVFLSKAGSPLIKEVHINEIMKEFSRQSR